jgi:fibronectin-binding autotransporter adhesin
VIVTLSGAAANGVTFSYDTFDGTQPAAHAGSDDTAVNNGTGTIRAGSTIGFVGVTVNGDKDVEKDEHFFVTISNPQNARLGSPTTQITLRNDD